MKPFGGALIFCSLVAVASFDLAQVHASLTRDFSQLLEDEEEILLYWRREGGEPLLPQELTVVGRPVVNCLDIGDIRSGSTQVQGKPLHYLEIVMTSDGANVLKDLTSKHRGRQLAVVVGLRIYSTPRLHAPIEKGTMLITGDFSKAEVDGLARELTGCRKQS